MTEKIYFYLLDIIYKIIENKPVIFMFGLNDKKEKIIVLDKYVEPYFWVIPKDHDKAKEKLLKLEVEKNDHKARVLKIEESKKTIKIDEVIALKVIVNHPDDPKILREVIKEWDFIDGIYEYDIDFYKRYLIDKNIIPMSSIEIDGDFIESDYQCRVFNAESILPSLDSAQPELSILAFDIETYNPDGKNIDYDKNPILMIAVYSNNDKKVFTYKKFDTSLSYIEFVDDEKSLLEKFREYVKTTKPDIITGYYSDGFDFPYIAYRSKKHAVKMDIGLDHSELHINNKGNNYAKITGIPHIDICKFIKRTMGSSMKTDSFTLNAVAMELLGEQKKSVELESLSKVWDNNPDKLEPFCEYNLIDSELTFKLTQKLMPNIAEFVKLIGLPMFDLTRMGFSLLIESYLLRHAFNANIIAPNRPHYQEEIKRRSQSFEGGFVYEPIPGLYHDIVVFDYRSLYPSIIGSHNIDSATINCMCCTDAPKVPEHGFWFCQKKKGFIPLVVEEIITKREAVKKALKRKKDPVLEGQQYGLKILANSFYGYLGFFGARWYSIEAARSVTAYGRHYIHSVIKEANNQQFPVIYSDTDSIFITLNNKSKEQAFAFCETINVKLPGVMELEFEGFYPSGIFVSLKEKSLGAKKKYALLREDGILKIRGFESVRRNVSLIAKEAQEHILKIILKENDKEKAFLYLKEMIKSIKEKEVENYKMIISVMLTKEIEKYDSISPHVAIAQKLKNMGVQIKPGMAIEFIVTAGRGKIREKAMLPFEVKQGNYDSDYYIHHQLLPALERIFDILGYSQEEILEEKEQKKLGNFFG